MRVGMSDASLVWSVPRAEQGSIQVNPTSGTDSTSANVNPMSANSDKTAVTVESERLTKAIDQAVKALQGPSTSIKISFHDKTNELMIQVYNRETGEVIREIPPEKWLNVVAKMREIVGILFDERV
jgi:flagellar protein FlaG